MPYANLSFQRLPADPAAKYISAAWSDPALFRRVAVSSPAFMEATRSLQFPL